MNAKVTIKNHADGQGYDVLASVNGQDFGVIATRFYGQAMIYDDVSVSLWAAVAGVRGITASDIMTAAGVSESDCDMIAITPSLT